MLKMYHHQKSNGGSAAFWEETWNDGEYDEALRFCETDPLRVIFEQYAKPGSLMLEGGCGRGQYVSFYSGRGVDVVGLDFACETLSRLHERERKLPLCGGNVAALPFRDQSFDVYFSNGVVEHFEDGAADALCEAWRVLRPHGTFLVSVPYLSPLRRATSIVKKSDRRTVTVAEPDGGQTRDDRVFFQYAYKPAEFERLLADAGFRVLSTFGYSIVWGLYDLPFFDNAMRRLQGMLNGKATVETEPAPREAAAAQHQPAVRGSRHEGSPQPSLIRRLALAEDDTVPVLGLAVRALRYACANMMMFVCHRVNNQTQCAAFAANDVEIL